MEENRLFAALTERAVSMGYEIVIDDSSQGDEALPANLVFVRGPEGAVYSVSVERVG